MKALAVSPQFLFQQRRVFAFLLVFLIFFATRALALASTQITLNFETQGVNLNSGTILGDENISDLFNTHPDLDFKIAYNADNAPHAVVIPNEAANVAVVSLADSAYDDVTVDNLVDVRFIVGSPYQPFTADSTLVVQTAAGTHYKLGNPVEDSQGVTFNYEPLATTQNPIVPFIPTNDNTQTITTPTTGLNENSSSSTFSAQSITLSFLAAVLLVMGTQQIATRKGAMPTRGRRRTAPALLLCLPLILMLFGSTQAASSIVNEEHKLLPVPDADDAEGDQAGYRVAIDGNTALIGAYQDAAPATRSGSASIYTFDGTDWMFQEELTASDGQGYDGFSSSLAIDSNTAVIGAPGNDDNGSGSGSAYVFTYDGSSWTEQTLLLASDASAGDAFGTSVAIHGNTIVVGAFRDEGDDNGSSVRDSGAAYIFTFDGSNWNEQAKLIPAQPELNDFFGYSVAIDGNTAVIGAYGEDDVAYDAGAAYIYTFDGSNWNEQTKLTASDGQASDLFSWSVDIDGNNILVGAYADDDQGYNSGSAYIYNFDGSNWSEQAKLIGGDVNASDLFGGSVDIEGNTAVISAYRGDNIVNGNYYTYSGAAYVFTFDGSSWSEQSKLISSDPAYADYFGYSIALSGNTVLAGVPYDDDAGTSSGSTYVYAYNDSNWTEQTKLLPIPDEATSEEFGYDVDIDGDVAIVGAYRDDNFVRDAGAAYIYKFNGTEWILQAKLFASDRASNDNFGKNVAIDGNTAIVSSRSSGSIGGYAGAVYVFTFDGTNWNETAKLVGSDTEAGDGFGSAIDISGNKILASSLSDRDLGSYTGSAYVFNYDGTAWTEEAKIRPSDSVGGHFFGYDVALEGTTALIGAMRDNGSGFRQGAAYIFNFDGSDWVETAKLAASNGVDREQLGYRVALHGNTAVVGRSSKPPYIFTYDGTNWAEEAALDFGYSSVAVAQDIILTRDNNLTNVYTYNGNSWVKTSELISSDIKSGDFFGWGMALSGDRAIIGAFRNANDLGYSGAAYVFHVNVPPVLSVDESLVTVNEGDLASNRGTVRDTNGDNVTLSADLGTVTNNGDGTWNWSFASSDDLVQTVIITADDGMGGVVETSFDLTVNNVAPTISDITAPAAPVNINDQAAYSIDLTFNDPAGANDEPYTCDFDLDNDGVIDATATGVTGNTCSAVLNYAEPGIYTVYATVTDKDGGSGSATSDMIVVYNPDGEFVTGGGWIDAQAGSCQDASVCDPTATGKANFGFNAKYSQDNIVPTGSSELNFADAGLNFHTTNYEWLVINQAGANAQLQGSGTLNGNNDGNGNPYKFTIQIQDNGNNDTIHIRIWSELADGTEVDVFDNGSAQEIGGGNIQVH